MRIWSDRTEVPAVRIFVERAKWRATRRAAEAIAGPEPVEDAEVWARRRELELRLARMDAGAMRGEVLR